MISAITGIVKAADWVQEIMFAQMYRGVSSTQRFGTVTPANGTETTMVTASRTYCRYYCFDDSLNITSTLPAPYNFITIGIDPGKVKSSLIGGYLVTLGDLPPGYYRLKLLKEYELKP